MRRPISSWTSFFTRLGLKLVAKPVSQKAPRHRSLRLENLQAREMLTQTEWIIDNYPDNGTPQYVETGTGWYNYHDPAKPVPYGDDSRWHGPASGVKATWTFADLPAGNYHVMATWEPRITFNPEAPYTVIKGTTTLGTVLVDQQFGPEQIDAAGVKWDSLAYVAITNETLKVEMAAAEEWWYTSADAIRVESVETLLPPDLTIEMTNDPDAVLPGERFQIDYRYTVGNQGFSGPLDIAYYYSTHSEFDEQEAVLLGVQTIPAGQGDLGFHNGKSPYFHIDELDEQGFFIHAKIDSTNAIAEGDQESNNVRRMIHTAIVSQRPQWIVDTRDEGFQATGSWYAVVGYWYHVFGEQYYRWDLRNHGPSTANDSATWSKDSLTSGQYEVLVTWGGGTASYDTTAQYTILDGATAIGEASVDQQTRPAAQPGAQPGAGVYWKSLGTFTVAGSPPSDGHTLNVRLGCDAAKYVSGDAVWIIDMNPLLISALGLAADNGTSTTDYITSDPRVTGMVTGTVGQNNHAVVEFDHDADGDVDGTLDPVALNSTFTYDPRDSESPLPAGDQVLKYRVLEFNADDEEVRRGNWQEFRYTFLRPDLVFDAITADGTDLHVAYEVVNPVAGPFQIGVCASPDGTSAGTPLMGYSAAGADLLAAEHTVTMDANFQDPEQDYYLLATLDSQSQLEETNESNNQGRLLTGVFVDSHGIVQVHGTDSDDTIALSVSDTIDVTLNSVAYHFPTTATAIHVRAHGGNDVLTASESLAVPVWAFGGLGNDQLQGGSANDTLYGGLGTDTLDGGPGTDVLDDEDQPPIVSLTGASQINEGQTYSLGLSSNEYVVDSWSINWGDGTIEPPNHPTSPTHTYTDNLANVQIAASATRGTRTGNQSKTITVNNVAPTASISNNGPVYEDCPVIVSLSGGTDPSSADLAAGLHYFFSSTEAARDAATYATSGTSSSQAFTFSANGTYPVYARVLDQNNGYTDYQTTVTVEEVADVLYWDPNGNAEGLGGTGNWTNDSEDQFWYNPSTSEYVGWEDDKWAVFCGDPGEVTIDDSVCVQGITFLSSGYTLSSGESGMIFAADDGLTVCSAADTTAMVNGEITNYYSTGLTKTGPGTLTLGSTENSYGGVTTIAEGTLEVDVSGAIPADGEVSVEGAGALVLDSGTVVDAERVTVGANASLEVKGTLRLDELTNAGTLRLTPGARVEQWTDGDPDPVLDLALYNTGTRTSGTGVFISGGSMGNDTFGNNTYHYELAAAGGGYLTLASTQTLGLTPFTTTLSGLAPATTHALRVVATTTAGGQVIYDGGTVSTTAQTDTSGWYRITGVTPSLPMSVTSISTNGFFTAPPPETVNALGAAQARISVVQAASVPNGPSIDYSWVYAPSPQEAVLQSFVGLVTDGSIPKVDPSGAVKIWRVWAQGEQDIEPCFQVYTYERDWYEPDGEGPPGGGYSAYWHSTSFTLGIEEGDTDPGDPCTSECGCAGGPGGPGGPAGPGAGCGAPSAGTGAAKMPMNAIDSRGGSAACGLGGIAGLTYDSRETTFDSGYGPGWSDVDELPSLVVARNTMAARFGAEKAIWFDVQPDGTFAARYGAKETLVHDAEHDLFILSRADGTRYEFFDAQSGHPQGTLYRSVASGGATVQVTGWDDNGRIGEVQYKTSSTVNPFHKRVLTYYTTGGGFGHIESVTLWENGVPTGNPVWTEVRMTTYDYYGSGATWSFALPSPAPEEHYQIFAGWIGDAQNATNAPFTIFDGTSVLRTERVDQTLSPGSSGQLLADLDASLFSSGKLVVRLSDDADARVVADAIRVERIVGGSSVETLVIDDGDAEYADDGGWSFSTPVEGAYGDDLHYRAGTHGPGANLFGLPGDLKTIVTQQWNGTGWSEDDTNYFRYYVDEADGAGMEHGLKRVVLANAYAALANYATQHSTTVEQLGESVVANYTCFYYEYDANARVTRQVNFGNSNESSFSSTVSANSNDYNHWFRKSVETRLDGNTTLLVKDINETGDSSLANLTNVNGTLFFRANAGASGAELWKSDGTEAGTVLVKDIHQSGDSSPGNLTNVNGTLFFSADDGVSGTELWRSDGTANGTVRVKDIHETGNSSPGNLTNVGGTLFFTADDGVNGAELWKTDPTTNVTIMVKDIDSSAGSSSPGNLTRVGGVLFFTASDGDTDPEEDHGLELWKSDGTASGTVLVKDIVPGEQGSSPANLTNVNGTLFFTADTSADGIELWKSDGTEGGTVLVKDDYSGSTGSSPANLVNVNGTLFFTALTSSSGIELWKSDGTEAGTVLVKDIYWGSTGSSPANLTNVNGTLFFTANDWDDQNNHHGVELWKSDGTEAGTVLVRDIYSGTTGSSPANLTNVNGTLFFTALTGASGVELWKSDGTENGTVLVKDINASGDSSPGNLTNVGGKLFFSANDGSHGTELWGNFGVTNTVYTNFLGQTLLTDLWNTNGTSATEDDTHTITYSRYDDEGRLILTVDPAAFDPQSGSYYNDALPDLTGYDGSNSPYLRDAEGLFQVTTYYTSTSPDIDEDTAGGVSGYQHQTAVAHGETAARLTPGSTNGPILLSASTYFARTLDEGTVDEHSIYPLASHTTYRADDGAGAATTGYAYAWYADKLQVKEKATTLPAVYTGQNGSGIAGKRFEYYTSAGSLEWTADELGRFTRYEYESVTNRLATTIEDVDADDGYSLPTFALAGWPALPGAGQGVSAITDYQTDALGRVTQTLGPAHTAVVDGTPTNVRTATWTFYKDADHEARSAQGYVVVSTSEAVIVGPVSITKTDRDGRVTGRIEAKYTGSVGGLATATIAQSDYTAWTAYKYQNTRLARVAVYDDIPTETSDPDADGFVGTSGLHYDKTLYGYEDYGAGKKGRQNKTVAADGTITRVVLDARGNVLETWIGTNDTGATDADPSGNQAAGNNMVKVASSTYNANGSVTESRAYFGSGANDYYASEYQYDWRERLTDVLSPADVVTHYDFDNLGRALWTKTYASADFTLTAAELRAQSENLYDRLGRVYESRVYEVDPTNGTIGDYLPSEAWYDARAQVIKTATGNGLFQKVAYDGLGRSVASYTCYQTSETAHADADDVAGDTVIDQTNTWYDRAGQTIASATFQRLPDDGTTTGPLTAANSYATAAVLWYDGLGRTVATADYGREDVGPAWTHYFFHRTAGTDAGGNYSAGDLFDVQRDGMPDEAQATPRAPNSSDDYIVALTEYDDAGRAYRSIDNLGRVNETQYDDAGRVVRTIQNRQNGTVEETDTDQDVTVEYEYDSGGRLVTMTAYNAKGSGGGVEHQATAYLYESAINGAWQTSAIYPDSADGQDVASLAGSSGTATAVVNGHGFSSGQWVYILGANQPQYNGRVQITVVNADTFTYGIDPTAPSPASGTIRVYDPAGEDQVKTGYDRLGRTTQTTDQRGVVHDYSFDTAGRPSADTVSSLGSTGLVDGAIRRIGTTYDGVGRVETMTSYSETAGVTALNQVKYVYNGWGQVAQEYQEHDGPVDGNSLFVEYGYETGATGVSPVPAKYVRLNQVIYPNGREVHYGYGSAGAIDDVMSRLSVIFDDANQDGDLDPAEDVYASYKYLGAARIVREDYADIDVKLDYAADNLAALDRFGRVADQVWTDYGAEPDAALDKYSYTYDRAGNRITRGNTLHTVFNETYAYDGVDRLTSSNRADDFDQAWTLDGLGNFSQFNDDGASQTRTANGVNEITGISGGWATPAYDRAGNMTTIPKPSNPANGLTAKYDAWNRLVEVSEGGILLARFSYDGTRRRIEQLTDFVEGVPQSATHYFLNGQQLIETREGSPASSPESLAPKYQNVWSPRYIDSLILRDEYSGGVLQAGSRLFYLSDANYNVTALVDASGDVVERYVYSPYGKATIYTPDWSATRPSSLYANTTLYTGRELDIATGLYYYRARYYSADLGSFVNRDPLTVESKDENLYRYCGNNPVLRVDPSGQSWLSDAVCWCLNAEIANEIAGDFRRAGLPTHNNQTGHNAMLHCTISCRIQQVWPSCSNAWDKREKDPTNPEDSMDLANNAAGRPIGGVCVSDCWKGCLDLWNAGKLTCLDKQGKKIPCPPPPPGFPKQPPAQGCTPTFPNRPQV